MKGISVSWCFFAPAQNIPALVHVITKGHLREGGAGEEKYFFQLPIFSGLQHWRMVATSADFC
ncbi:hypothetical protein DUQ00_14635 [Salmonella bongori]|nr:hypothetical protein [Salmonella bongori]ECC9597527.1 hypothetical protein [Salmonella bongori]EDP8662866.1 hypothetical protein [Salmonella bongori]